MSKPVVAAYLYEAFFTPGDGQLPNTLPSGSKTLKDFKMTLQDNGTLFLEWTVGAMTRSYTVSAQNIKGVAHPPVLTPKAVPVAETKVENNT